MRAEQRWLSLSLTWLCFPTHHEMPGAPEDMSWEAQACLCAHQHTQGSEICSQDSWATVLSKEPCFCLSALLLLLLHERPFLSFHPVLPGPTTEQLLRLSWPTGPPAACLLLHLVDLVCVHHDAGTQQEGEHQLVLLKEAAADVAVEAVGQVAIDVGDALLQVVCKAER